MQILRKPLWILGGIFLFLFTARGQQWQSKASLPSPRQGMAAAVLSDTIYVIGGSETEIHGLDVVQAYNVQQDLWETNIPSLNIARTNSAAVSFDEKIYVFGGRDHNQMISEVELYDPVNSNQWVVVSQLPTPREGLSAVVVDSLIWVIGGAAFQTKYDIVECYNPAVNSWNTLSGSLNVPRVASVAAVINDSVYVFGGFYFGPLNSYEKYVPNAGWTAMGNMSYSCGSSSGAEVNGKMWIVGGENHDGILAKTQYTDPAFPGIWNTGPSMQLQRKNLSVARVGNYLFAIGGRFDQHMSGLTDGVEALDVVTGITEPLVANPLKDFYLKQNFPNPFNNSTSFEVYIDKPTEATIGVSNILGQTVRHIYRGKLAGRRHFEFDGRDDFGRVLPSGNYFIYLTDAEEKRVIKATLSK
jgi:N-acetylneuraminic acid mutarotase